MTDKMSKSGLMKIKTQPDEQENYVIVGELVELDNPLAHDNNEEYIDYDEELNSEQLAADIASSSNLGRQVWDFELTQRMLKIFIDHKKFLDKMPRVKERYEFIRKKLNGPNCDKDSEVSISSIENKIKALIRTYRSNRSRPNWRKSEFDQYLEAIFDSSRLGVNKDDTKMKVCDSSGFSQMSNFKSEYQSEQSDVNSSDSDDTNPVPVKRVKLVTRSEHNLSLRSLSQATQTDMGDNLIMQLVEIEKNQQRRWEEQKALTARIERAKAERFARKESLLKDLVDCLKERLV